MERNGVSGLIKGYHILPTCPTDPMRIRANTGYWKTPRTVSAMVSPSFESSGCLDALCSWHGAQNLSMFGSSLFASVNPDHPWEKCSVRCVNVFNTLLKLAILPF